jgi:hypothetical protein
MANWAGSIPPAFFHSVSGLNVAFWPERRLYSKNMHLKKYVSV